jgi:hypothetical protein
MLWYWASPGYQNPKPPRTGNLDFMVGNVLRCDAHLLKKQLLNNFLCIWKDGLGRVPALLFIEDILC